MTEKTNEFSSDLSEIKICTVLRVPDDLKGEAIAAAVKERADNVLLPGMMPLGLNSMAMMASNAMPVPAIAVLTQQRWQPGRIIKVRFLDDPPSVVKQKIEYFAHQWEQFVSVRFSFGDEPDAEIRITCTLGIGSWSYHGTDALVIDQNKPTMNYGWFTETTPDIEFSRTVLHEFGHALSGIHEHQHPSAGIPWNRPAVYEYYKSTQGWSKKEVDQQVFTIYNKNLLNTSTYDRTSIMHYAVDKKLLLDESFAVGWNTDLSAMDKQFMRNMYP
jgi:hypothetical protein